MWVLRNIDQAFARATRGVDRAFGIAEPDGPNADKLNGRYRSYVEKRFEEKAPDISSV